MKMTHNEVKRFQSTVIEHCQLLKKRFSDNPQGALRVLCEMKNALFKAKTRAIMNNDENRDTFALPIEYINNTISEMERILIHREKRARVTALQLELNEGKYLAFWEAWDQYCDNQISDDELSEIADKVFGKLKQPSSKITDPEKAAFIGLLLNKEVEEQAGEDNYKFCIRLCQKYGLEYKKRVADTYMQDLFKDPKYLNGVKNKIIPKLPKHIQDRLG